MVRHFTPRRVRQGTYALDCYGNILHFSPGVITYEGADEVAKDVELQILGMVEVKVVQRLHTVYYPIRFWDPYYLYQTVGGWR